MVYNVVVGTYGASNFVLLTGQTALVTYTANIPSTASAANNWLGTTFQFVTQMASIAFYP